MVPIFIVRYRKLQPKVKFQTMQDPKKERKEKHLSSHTSVSGLILNIKQLRFQTIDLSENISDSNKWYQKRYSMTIRKKSFASGNWLSALQDDLIYLTYTLHFLQHCSVAEQTTSRPIFNCTVSYPKHCNNCILLKRTPWLPKNQEKWNRFCCFYVMKKV